MRQVIQAMVITIILLMPVTTGLLIAKHLHTLSQQQIGPADTPQRQMRMPYVT